MFRNGEPVHGPACAACTLILDLSSPPPYSAIPKGQTRPQRGSETRPVAREPSVLVGSKL